LCGEGDENELGLVLGGQRLAAEGVEMTIKQVALDMDVTSQTVLRWVSAKLLPVVRVNRRVLRVRRDDYERFLERRKK
jgi:excisionase family DNA binding protein